MSEISSEDDPRAPRFKPDDIVGNYVLMQPIASSPIIEVWAAVRQNTQHTSKEAVVKCIKPGLDDKLELIARVLLTNEIRILRELKDHPALVPVLASNIKLSYFAMEPRGVNLEQYLEQNVNWLSWDDLLSLGTLIAARLDDLHRHGVVHGDIKLKNILVWRGQIYLIDLGVALCPGVPDFRLRYNHVELYTRTFAAPELVFNDEPSTASDVYALGNVLYRLLAGRMAFEANSPKEAARLNRYSNAESPREHNAAIPWSVAEVILRCLSKRPNQRPAATEVACVLAARLPSRIGR